MAARELSAKSILHTFMDKASKGSKPAYTTSEAKNALGHFECVCTLPEVSTVTGAFQRQQFRGNGASKGLASAKAAESAWTFVQSTKAHEAFQSHPIQEDLWTAICSSCTSEVCFCLCMHITLTSEQLQGPCTIIAVHPMCNSNRIVSQFWINR